MISIHPSASRGATSYDEPAHGVIPLAERMAVPAGETDMLDDGGPKAPTGSELVSQWAINMFIEKIFFGDEEENGIPELSIDI